MLADRRNFVPRVPFEKCSHFSHEAVTGNAHIDATYPVSASAIVYVASIWAHPLNGTSNDNKIVKSMLLTS